MITSSTGKPFPSPYANPPLEYLFAIIHKLKIQDNGVPVDKDYPLLLDIFVLDATTVRIQFTVNDGNNGVRVLQRDLTTEYSFNYYLLLDEIERCFKSVPLAILMGDLFKEWVKLYKRAMTQIKAGLLAQLDNFKDY